MAVDPSWQETQVGVEVGGVVPVLIDTIVEWSIMPPANDGACGLWQSRQLADVIM